MFSSIVLTLFGTLLNAGVLACLSVKSYPTVVQQLGVKSLSFRHPWVLQGPALVNSGLLGRLGFLQWLVLHVMVTDGLWLNFFATREYWWSSLYAKSSFRRINVQPYVIVPLLYVILESVSSIYDCGFWQMPVATICPSLYSYKERWSLSFTPSLVSFFVDEVVQLFILLSWSRYIM